MAVGDRGVGLGTKVSVTAGVGDDVVVAGGVWVGSSMVGVIQAPSKAASAGQLTWMMGSTGLTLVWVGCACEDAEVGAQLTASSPKKESNRINRTCLEIIPGGIPLVRLRFFGCVFQSHSPVAPVGKSLVEKPGQRFDQPS